MKTHQIQNLQWREIFWQRPFELEVVQGMLSHLATLSPRGAIVWEVRGHQGKIRYLLGADEKHINRIEETLKAHGEMQFKKSPEDSRKTMQLSKRIKITHPSLSLKLDLSETVIRSALAAMAEDKYGTETVLQVVLGGSYHPTYVPDKITDPHTTWLEALLGEARQASNENRKSIREKASQHGFQTTVRIGVSDTRAIVKLRNMLGAIRLLESAGVRIYEETENPNKLNSAHVPWHFPLRLSAAELSNFLLLPTGETEFPGIAGLHPKLTLPPSFYRSPTNAQSDRSFATSLDITSPRKLSISPKDALEHTILLGPTGSGKSTAMAHLILADIKAGRSVLVIDPKADLVNDILARIPEDRANDVVILDPSDPCPVGFNPLAFKEYGSSTLIADAILGVLKEIWADSWGVRIQDVLSASLLTLVEIEEASLLWLPEFLTNSVFRKKLTTKVKDQIALAPFWEQFEALRPSEQRLQIEPILNKLRQFSLRPGLRNVLGQSNPKFSLMDLFLERKIILVPLNKGIIGSESARLLGSLLVGMTWTLALSRATLPVGRRHMVSVFIDELQDYLSLPTDLSDALAQARGLGMSLTLAHQYRDQLPLNIRAGIDANARNKICFGLNATDAKAMASMAPELTAEDFMTLPRYEIYTSFQHNGKNTGWIRGRTLPSSSVIQDPVKLRAQSMHRYGIPVEKIEADYMKNFKTDRISEEKLNDTPIGRRKRL